MANSDLRKLGRDFKTAGDKASRETPRVVKRAAVNIKRSGSALVNARSDVHAPNIHRTVDFDESGGAGYGTAEIGYNKGKNQGPLGNLLEFGSPEHNTEGKRELEQALRMEAPRFIREMDKLADPL